MTENCVLLKTSAGCPTCQKEGIFIFKKIYLQESKLGEVVSRFLKFKKQNSLIKEMYICLSCDTSFQDACFQEFVDPKENERLLDVLVSTRPRNFRDKIDKRIVYKEDCDLKSLARFVQVDPIKDIRFPVRVQIKIMPYKRAVRGATYAVMTPEENKVKYTLSNGDHAVFGREEEFWLRKDKDWLMEVYGYWDGYKAPVCIPRSAFMEEDIPTPELVKYTVA